MTFNHFLLWFFLILGSGKIGGEIFERFKLPAVLGELIAGILVGIGGLGALSHTFHGLIPFVVDSNNQTLTTLGQLGAVMLLFEAGLDSDLGELKRLGLAAVWLASAGVIFTFGLCFLLCKLIGFPSLTAVFIGGAMASTSVGISARTFSDLKKSHTSEAKTVLGAAVADDVMGLVILGVITGIVATRSVSMMTIGLTALAAIMFIVLSLPIGLYLAPKIMRWASKLQTRAALSVAGLLFCFVLAAIAGKAAGLSPIIGAFAAGIILGNSDFKERLQTHLKPIADIFIPVFFVLMGAAMPLSAISPFTHAGRIAIGLSFMLALAALSSKVLAGLSTPFGKINRLVVGCGMIPRGEVTLIFAAYGLKSAVISGSLYSSILIVVMFTTFVTPPILKLAMDRAGRLAVNRKQESELVSDTLSAMDDGPGMLAVDARHSAQQAVDPL